MSTAADRIRDAMGLSLRRRLIAWAVRWTLSFLLIALIVWYWPEFAWLWWAGAIIAMLSLATMIAMHAYFLPRLAAKAEAAESAAAAADSLDDAPGTRPQLRDTDG